MRQRSAKDLQAELTDARAESSLYLRALQDVVTGAVESTQRSDDAAYTFQLTRSASPCGGLVIITFHCPGQRDSVSVRPAEAMLTASAIGTEWSPSCWDALSRVALARNRLAA